MKMRGSENMSWVKEYGYAFLASRKNLREIINKVSVWKALGVFVIAIALVSIPAEFSYYNYLVNISINSCSVLLINLFISLMVSYIIRKNLWQIFIGLVYITSIAFLINSLLLLLLYLVGIPFGASNVLWAASATLISTYYFVVLLAIASGSVIEEEKHNLKRYFVEGTALILWFVYVFYILLLTV